MRAKGGAEPTEKAYSREKQSRDVFFPLRRALMIRKSLNLSSEEPAPIDDDGLVDALLEVPTYRHGSRSLDKLVRELRWEKNAQLNSGALPDRDRLSMLIDLDEFFGLLSREKKRR
jgi:hypothetical protein